MSGNAPEPLAVPTPCGRGSPVVGSDGVSCESPGTPTGSVSGGMPDVVSSGAVAGSDPEDSPLPSVGAESGGVASGSGGGGVASGSDGGVVVSESEGGVVAGDSIGVVVPELSEVSVSTATPVGDSLELESAVVSLA